MNKVSDKKPNILKALFDIKPVDDSGRVDVAKIGRVQPVVNLGNQKPAEKAGNGESISGTQSPNLTLNYSIANRSKMSNGNVDNFSIPWTHGESNPEDSSVKFELVARSGPTVKSSYQRQTKKQNPEVEVSDALRQDKPKLHFGASPAKLLEKYINSKLSIKKELTAVGARVEKGSPDAKPRYRPIFVRQKSELMTSQVVPTFDVPTSSNDYQAVLSEINHKIAPAVEVALVGEPRRMYPFESTNDFVSSRDLRSHDV